MPNNTQDGPEAGFRLVDFLPYRLAVMTDRVSHVFAQDFEGQHDVSMSEWRVLSVVAEHGVLSPTAVATVVFLCAELRSVAQKDVGVTR